MTEERKNRAPPDGQLQNEEEHRPEMSEEWTNHEAQDKPHRV